MFRTLLKKELFEQFRTSKFLIILAVLFISGLISPLFAKYTPVILKAIPDIPAGIVDSIPTPTIIDSITQYIKNVSQFGVLLVVLMNMGAIAQEKERGTAAMLLAKPVSRTAIVIAKWSASVVVVIAGMLAAAIAMAVYTTILFGSLDWRGFIILNLLMILFLVVYATIAICASSLAKNQGTAAALAFTGLAVVLIASSIPWISDFMPSMLLTWGTALTVGAPNEPSWWAVAVSILLILGLLVVASLRFKREEI